MLTLTRTYKANRTEGVIDLPDGTRIATLERPWLNNQPFVSCIPSGVYVVERNKTGKHQYYGLKDVLDRSHIEIHPANYVYQLEGCIAPCMALEKGKAINSLEACELLINWFQDDSWALEIR